MTKYHPADDTSSTLIECEREGCSTKMMIRTARHHDMLCPTHYYEGWGDSHPLTQPLLDDDALAALKGGD